MKKVILGGLCLAVAVIGGVILAGHFMAWYIGFLSGGLTSIWIMVYQQQMKDSKSSTNE